MPFPLEDYSEFGNFVITLISLVEETGVPGENHRPVASHFQTLSHNVVSSTLCLSRLRTYDVSDNNWEETKVNIRLSKKTSTTSNLIKQSGGVKLNLQRLLVKNIMHSVDHYIPL